MVRDSIVMFGTIVRAGAVVDHAIIDKQVSVEAWHYPTAIPPSAAS